MSPYICCAHRNLIMLGIKYLKSLHHYHFQFDPSLDWARIQTLLRECDPKILTPEQRKFLIVLTLHRTTIAPGLYPTTIVKLWEDTKCDPHFTHGENMANYLRELRVWWQKVSRVPVAATSTRPCSHLESLRVELLDHHPDV
jgi:hypothetical protein